MGVPFREDDDPGVPGLTAYLRIRRETGAPLWQGGLLVVNRIDEPVEFVHVRMRAPPSAPCGTDLGEPARAALLAALLDRCASVPDAFHYIPAELGAAVFRERIALDIPAVAFDGEADRLPEPFRRTAAALDAIAAAPAGQP
ncbi:MAG: hypothetical protein ACRELX_11325 [Longimicrobiales bacterium]